MAANYHTLSEAKDEELLESASQQHTVPDDESFCDERDSSWKFLTTFPKREIRGGKSNTAICKRRKIIKRQQMPVSYEEFFKRRKHYIRMKCFEQLSQHEDKSRHMIKLC